MIISTPEEFRLYQPSHVYHDLDNMQGFLNNSEADFLAPRIGKPLLYVLRAKYAELRNNAECQGCRIADLLVNVNDPTVPTAAVSANGNISDPNDDAWLILISLCQSCVVFDACYRSSSLNAISANDAGLNIAESHDYAQASDNKIEKYESRLIKESHAAIDRLLEQLEVWQKWLTNALASDDDDTDSAFSVNPNDAIRTIVGLWKQSDYYYFADGLMFNTAMEFHTFVDIYQSREKFIQLLPDIRYCQEVHIVAELGEPLFNDLMEKHKSGTLNPTETKAFKNLRLALALQVEARSKLFKRAEAKDEAQGNLRLALRFIHKHQLDFDRAAMEQSPLFCPQMWPPLETDTDPDNAVDTDPDAPVPDASASGSVTYPCEHHGSHTVTPPSRPVKFGQSPTDRPHHTNGTRPRHHCDCPPQPYRSEMLITSII